MARQAAEITLKGRFGQMAVQVDGEVEVELTDGGGFTLKKDGNEVLSYKPFSADATIAAIRVDEKTAYKVGSSLPDGWIVGPVSPDTGHPVSFEPAVGALEGYQTWHKGEEHAAQLRGQGHANARQPSAGEWTAAYNEVVRAGRNQEAKLNTSDSYPSATYWTSASYPANPDHARTQRLDNGDKGRCNKNEAAARVRCIRNEPGVNLL